MSILTRWAVRTMALVALTASIAESARAESCRVQGDRLGPFVPDYVQAQSGGYLGFLTLGSGYLVFDSVLDLGAYYGWVPEAVGGEGIHELAVRVAGRVKGWCIAENWNWVFVYGGVGVLFTFGDGFFLSVPDRYPDERYYRKTGRRGFFVLGSELQVRQSLRSTLSHALFYEITALDQYIGAWGRNVGTIPFHSMFASSFGYRLYF